MGRSQGRPGLSGTVPGPGDGRRDGVSEVTRLWGIRRNGYGCAVRRLGSVHGSLSPWGRLVAASAVIVAGVAIVVVVWWVATGQERESLYTVRGSLDGITLDLGDASAVIVGAGERASVEVRRMDETAFGRQPHAVRSISNGVLRIENRGPTAVPHSCSSHYRLAVPDNVPVTVRTSSGDVTFSRFRASARVDTSSGNIYVGSFCGFSLQANTNVGDVDANTICPPDMMALRSRSGSVHATVPRGRYRVDADSDSGTRLVQGIETADDAPFQIQALSTSGDVVVEGLR